MKIQLITTILVLTASFAFGHGEIELGPNKGRILEFSANETMHGEVTEKDGKLHIALLDNDMKPVKVAVQSLTATAGTRQAPVKNEVTKNKTSFILSVPKEGEWIILQYKENDSAKAITARLHFDTKACAPCGKPEWRCACGAEEKK
jgi:hypothetical protein|tara:strand:- start:835 stop:1275 length:441 start_codon:yes stop_codon:yes gene_type:complete